MTKTYKPYVSEQRGSHWVCVDTRTGQPVSYPTSKSQCANEVQFMNETYAELMAEAATAGAEGIAQPPKSDTENG